MTQGVQRFNGERLRQAREIRSISSQAVLAEQIGVSREMVSNYESGTGSPSPETFRRLASVLGFPLPFFLRKALEPSPEPIFFRSMKAAVAIDRKRARSLLEIMTDILEFVSEQVEIPEPSLTKLDLFGAPRSWTDDQIEHAAAETRRALGVKSGPLPNLAWLLEHQGVVIARERLAEKELDGLSQWVHGRPMVLLNNTKTAARSRSDLAHEVAHLVLHHRCDEAHIKDPVTFNLIERQAHRFAGALLLPSDEFSEDVWTGSLSEFASLKLKWRVSIQAMVYRARTLDLISEAQSESLWRAIGRKGWKRAEPYEEEIAVERPMLLGNSLRLLVDEGVMLPAEILDLMPLDPSVFERLAGVSPGFFNEATLPSIVSLASRRS